jgi:hypothetical protein
LSFFREIKNGLLTEEQSKELQDKKKLKKDLEKELKRCKKIFLHILGGGAQKMTSFLRGGVNFL